MLKKLLPELKKLITNLKRLKVNLQNPKTQNKNISDVNLLRSLDTKQETKRITPSIIISTNVVVLFTFFIVLVFFITNLYLNQKLSRLLNDRNDLLSFIDSNSELEKSISNISKLINIYKEKKATIRKSSADLEVIIPSINKYSLLSSMKYSDVTKTYKVKLSTDKIINYAYLIHDLLSSPLVDSIVLNDVIKSGPKNEYTSNLDILMK